MDYLKIILRHFNENPSYCEILTKGYTNDNYKFTIKEKNYVLKIFNNKNRQSEKLIVKAVNFPPVVVENVDYRIENFIDFEEVDYKRDLKEIITAMRQFHMTRVEGVLSVDEIFIPFIAGDSVAMRIFMSFQLSKFDRLLHFDLISANMMKLQGSIRFIDFEYSCYGPALCDIASLVEEASTDYGSSQFYSSELEYSKEEIISMIREYFKNENIDLEKTYEEVQRLRGVFMLLWFLWAVKISKLKSKDGFDYRLYGMAKLKRLYTHVRMTDSDFDHLSKLLN